MRFEHNLPVLVQLRWLPVGGPYAAFNLPVRFSPMSVGAGGWVAEMARKPGPGDAPAAARRPGSAPPPKTTGGCSQEGRSAGWRGQPLAAAAVLGGGAWEPLR